MSDGVATGAENPDESTGSSDDQGAKFTDADMAKVRRSYDGKLEKLRGEVKSLKDTRSEFFSTHDVDSFDDLAERLTSQQKLDGDHADLQRALKKAERELVKAATERDTALAAHGTMVKARNQSSIKDAVYSAASKTNAREKDVYALLLMDGRVGIDEEGEVTVLDGGEPAHGITVDQLVTQLVADNKHLQRPTPAQGGGSLPAASNSSPGQDFGDRNQRIEALRSLGFGKGGR